MNTVSTHIKPAFGQTLKTGLITGAIAAVANVIIWFVAGLVQPMTVPFVGAIITSLLGLIVGSLIYFGLSRFLGARTNLVFTIICVVFLILYAFVPINAMSQEPAPGLGVFNMATMVATQIMHLVAGGLAITRLRGLMPS